jgi:hypothetical protein
MASAAVRSVCCLQRRLKFKIAHRRAAAGRWSVTPKTQRKRMIRFLPGVIEDLEQQAPPTARDEN